MQQTLIAVYFLLHGATGKIQHVFQQNDWLWMIEVPIVDIDVVVRNLAWSF